MTHDPDHRHCRPLLSPEQVEGLLTKPVLAAYVAVNRCARGCRG